MSSGKGLIDKALDAKRESKCIEFKEAFDPASSGDWCELIKDIVAIANSGGGVILIGVNDAGEPSKASVLPLLQLDCADVANKLFKYLGCEFANFDIVEAERKGHQIAAINIDASDIPYVFSKPGTYDIGGGKQKTAFGVGTVYFRHGAKSEPGVTEDLRRAFGLQVAATRKEWSRGIRKVVQAPKGSSVVVLPPSVSKLPSDRMSVRVVNDPHAPAVIIREDDLLANYPYTYRNLAEKARERYSDFVENATFHAIKKQYEDDPACSMVRLLNLSNPKSLKTRFFSEEMLARLDKHYCRRC